MSGRDIALWVIIAATAAAVVLTVTEDARFRRGTSAWWDILAVALAFYFGTAAVIGWIWFLFTGVFR